MCIRDRSTPLGRAGQPAALAPLYVFLASNESSYISAQPIGVTGGIDHPDGTFVGVGKGQNREEHVVGSHRDFLFISSHSAYLPLCS